MFGLIALFDGASLLQRFNVNQAMRKEIIALETRLNDEETKTAKAAEPLTRLRKAVERRRLFTPEDSSFDGLLSDIGSALKDRFLVTGLTWNDNVLSFDVHLIDEKHNPSSDDLTRQNTLAQFDELTARLREALPEARIEMTRAPYAKDSAALQTADAQFTISAVKTGSAP